jgi:hypothetical protein
LQGRLEKEFFAYGICLTRNVAGGAETQLLRWETDGGTILNKETVKAASLFILFKPVERVAA